jgi:parallel beta-helix repeat protein
MNRRLIARNLFASAVGAVASSPKTDAENSTTPCFARTAAEAAAGIAPTNYSYSPGDVRRYGADPTGIQNSSTSLTNALLSNSSVYIPAGAYSFTQQSPFGVRSGQTVFGDGAATVCTFSYNAGNNLQASGATGAVVRRLKIVVGGLAGSGYTGAVALIRGCSGCIVEECDISGVSGCGVYVENGSECIIRSNFFHDFETGNHDQADVYIRGLSTTGNGCTYCIVDGNECFGGGWHGIACLTGSVAGPAYNTYCTISNNRVGQHSCYGILEYSGGAAVDHFNQILGNYIENIQGTQLEHNSGAGIYAVAAGGDVIANNVIRNCCVQTTSEGVAPAGIGISSTVSTLTPVTVTGNIVSGMTRFSGILVVSCAGAVLIEGNSVNQPVANKTGSAIKVNGSSNVSVQGNMIYSPSPGSGILVQAESDDVSNISTCGNTVRHSGAGVTFYSTSGGLFRQVLINGNSCVTSSPNACFSLSNVSTGTVSHNTLANGASTTCVATACTQTMFTGNTMAGASTFAFEARGTCTGSFVDKSNYMGSESGTRLGQSAIANGATGMHVEQLGIAAPAFGTAMLGDVIYSTSGSTPFAWQCTATGSPGTWIELALPSAAFTSPK